MTRPHAFAAGLHIAYAVYLTQRHVRMRCADEGPPPCVLCGADQGCGEGSAPHVLWDPCGHAFCEACAWRALRQPGRETACLLCGAEPAECAEKVGRIEGSTPAERGHLSHQKWFALPVKHERKSQAPAEAGEMTAEVWDLHCCVT